MADKKGLRIKELEAIIKQLIAIDFRVPSEMDGDAGCFYCGAYLEGGEDHDNECPYIKAKEALNKTK